MDTKKIPPIITLSAALACSIVTYVNHYELKDALVALLCVIIGFYIFSLIVKFIFDKAGMNKEAVDQRIREEEEARKKEQAEAEEAARLENVDGAVFEKEQGSG